MNTPVVLITGALTGIGRATAVAFAKKGRASLFRGDATNPAGSWPLSFASGRGGRIPAHGRAPRGGCARPGQ